MQWHKIYKLFAVCFVFISAASLSACISVKQEPAPFVTYGAKQGAGSAGVHTVLEGDTLYGVSQRYKLPMRSIITVNHLSPPYALSVGFRMKLPPPNDYKVREGDNLYKVSRFFDVSMNQIARLNNLREPYALQVGQVLRIPSPGAQSASAQAVSRPPPSSTVRPAQKAVRKASIARPKSVQKAPKLSGNGKFLRPVEGRVISSYGPKKGGLHNDGVNIQAPRGTPVRTAENGVVVYVGDDLKGYGNLVLVRHEKQIMSAYAHLDKITVSRGQVLKRGQTLGTVGSTGQVDSPQLHFEVRKGTKAINPDRYI